MQMGIIPFRCVTVMARTLYMHLDRRHCLVDGSGKLKLNLAPFTAVQNIIFIAGKYVHRERRRRRIPRTIFFRQIEALQRAIHQAN